MNALYRFSRVAGAAAACFLITPTAVLAATESINFDEIIASPNPVKGVALESYLLARGITILAQSEPNSLGIWDARCEYGTCTTNNAVFASSLPNIFTQLGTNAVSESYTLGFAQPLNSLSFTRAKLFAGPTGITSPSWTATAFNGTGASLGSVSESLIASFSNVPAAPFTLDGGNDLISKVTFVSSAHNFAAFGSPILDDFVLNPSPAPVPLPMAAWLFGSAFGGLGFLRRRGA